ncbi:hypothetical protein [Polaromonas sp.]|uniref:hypothetical protein n=1 Tax=Polaromonas sp. TaxID=1869339 RepID=UPI00286B4F99|nr:hypothetical protein [Polaromonas sp.]
MKTSIQVASAVVPSARNLGAFLALVRSSFALNPQASLCGKTRRAIFSGFHSATGLAWGLGAQMFASAQTKAASVSISSV